MEDIEGENVDVDNFLDNFFMGGCSSEKNPAFLVPPLSVMPLARSFGFSRVE